MPPSFYIELIIRTNYSKILSKKMQQTDLLKKVTEN